MKQQHTVYFFAIWVLLATAWPSMAQRKEIELQGNADNYQMRPLGEHGLAVFFEQKNKALGGANIWHFQIYDTLMQEQWKGEMEVKNWLTYLGHDADGSKLYLLFNEFTGDLYQFVVVDLKEKTVEKRSFHSLKRFSYEYLKVMDGKAFLCGEVKDTPVLIHFDISVPKGAGKAKLLPTSTTKKAEIGFLDKDVENKLVHFSFVAWKGKESAAVVQSYDPGGELLSNIALPHTTDRNLLSAKLSLTNEGNALIMGTYANGSARLADGLFLAEYDGPEQRYMKFYNFTDLKHFFDYLPQKAQERIERKQQKADAELSLQYRLLVHDVIVPDSNQYLFVAEAYYPTYRYDYAPGMYGAYRYGGYPMGSRMVFDGYQYTHAMVASFSKDGNLLWDSSFELDGEDKTFVLRKTVQASVLGNELYMGYNIGRNVRLKWGAVGSASSEKSEIPMYGEGDQVRSSYKNMLHAWYGPYLLAWGYQRIKGGDGKRSVFFMHKINAAKDR